MTTAAPARRARVSGFGRLAARLSRMLGKQIDALEADPPDGFSEARVKALLLLAKTLAAMEDATQRNGKAADGEQSEPGDLLEFRRELERRIAALGPAQPDEPLPGDAVAG